MKFILKNKLAALLVITLLIIVITLYVRKKNREEQEALLFAALGDKSTATGTSEDLKENRAFDPGYYKAKKAPTLKMDYTKASKEIWDSKGTVKDNEELTLAVYGRLRSKLHASYLASVFQGKYKRNLYEYLESFMDQKYMDRLNAIIGKLSD